VKAVYRHGVLHPEEPLALKDGEAVEVTVTPIRPGPREAPPSFLRFLAGFLAIAGVGVAAMVGVFIAIFFALKALTGVAGAFLTIEVLFGLGFLAGIAALLWQDVLNAYRKRVQEAAQKERRE